MKEIIYPGALQNIEAMTQGETDLIAVMSTVSCELYHAFDYFNWVGFYRLTDESTLKVGPYQGTHGCLTIDIEKGVCGMCAKTGKTRIENDVSKVPHHIACSADTKSEMVVPVKDHENNVRAVLDIDSIEINSFDKTDKHYLEKICEIVSKRYT